MHARVTFIEAAAESVASLEHADAAFTTDAPFLSFAEPALLLALSTLRTLGTERRNRDLCDSHLLRRRFVGSGEKAGVAGDHARRHAEPLLVLFNRRDQQGRVRGPFVIHLVGDDDLVFRLLDFDHLAELGGLARFPLRMISVVCSNRLTILPAELVMPWMIRARVWLTTCCTRGSMVSSSFFMPSRRSEEHTSELQSHSNISYAVFC